MEQDLQKLVRKAQDARNEPQLDETVAQWATLILKLTDALVTLAEIECQKGKLVS